MLSLERGSGAEWPALSRRSRRRAPVSVRLMIVERRQLVRDALRIAIDSTAGLDLVAETGDPSDAAVCAAVREPDVVLLDVDWPSLAGMAAIPSIRVVAPQSLIVTYSSEPGFEAHGALEAARAAIASGADAHLNVSATLEEMITLASTADASSPRRPG